VHPARSPDMSLERMADCDVSVDGGGDKHVRSGEHRYDLDVSD